ncbi:uncharacterized protein N7515_000074 [Penicillium bovifimosum]|uniref:DNA 3'-5' helicase n=1 Tax=Penicillium bovifimosum TaxID=126998 RepID=A0A9W9LB38_9EURO|nr:uncharacterized protein N7515_000074 [Penicillium bovifimosum]KAJ5145510.1 hypothetical protein N7515_000074 [Penicillium bovifimosum]
MYHGKAVDKDKMLGMGVDIPDIRCIIHIGHTRTLLDYAQESGRAGRDGQPSEAIIIQPEGTTVPKFALKHTSEDDVERVHGRTHCGDAGQTEEHCDGCDPNWNAGEPEDEEMEGDEVTMVPDTPLQSQHTSATHPFTTDLVPLPQSPRGSPSPALTDDELPSCESQVRSSAQIMQVPATSDSSSPPSSPTARTQARPQGVVERKHHQSFAGPVRSTPTARTQPPTQGVNPARTPPVRTLLRRFNRSSLSGPGRGCRANWPSKGLVAFALHDTLWACLSPGRGR